MALNDLINPRFLKQYLAHSDCFKHVSLIPLPQPSFPPFFPIPLLPPSPFPLFPPFLPLLLPVPLLLFLPLFLFSPSPFLFLFLLLLFLLLLHLLLLPFLPCSLPPFPLLLEVLTLTIIIFTLQFGFCFTTVLKSFSGNLRTVIEFLPNPSLYWHLPYLTLLIKVSNEFPEMALFLCGFLKSLVTVFLADFLMFLFTIS